MTIASLFVNLGMSGMGDIEKETARAEKQFDSLGGVASRVGGMLAGVFTVGAIVNATNKLIDFAGEMDDMSAQTGISTAALQEFKDAGGQVGVTLDNITGVVGTMQKRLAGGDSSAAGAIGILKLEFDNLRKMQPETQFSTIAGKIAEIEDPAARVKLAMDIMGKGALQVMPLLVSDLDLLRQRANDLGVVLSSDTIVKLDDLGDSMDTLSVVGQGVLASVFVPFVPLLQSVAGFLMGLGSAMSIAQTAFEQLLSVGAGAIKTLVDVTVKGYDAINVGGIFDAPIKAGKEWSEWLGTIEKDLGTTKTASLTATKDMTKGFDVLNVETGKHSKALEEIERQSKAWRSTMNDIGEKQMKADAEAMGELAKQTDRTFMAMRMLPPVIDNANHSADAFLPNLASLDTQLLLIGAHIPDTQWMVSYGDSLITMTSRTTKFLRDSWAGTKDTINGTVQNMLSDLSSKFAGWLDGFLPGWAAGLIAGIADAFTQAGAMAVTSWAVSAAGLGGGAASGIGGLAMAGGSAAAAAGGAAAASSGASTTAAATSAGIGAGTALAVTGGAAAAAVLAWAIWKKGLFRGGEEAIKVNPSRDAFLAQFGKAGTGADSGFMNLAEKLTELTGQHGGGNLFKALIGADTVSEFDAATTAIEGILGTVDQGLTPAIDTASVSALAFGDSVGAATDASIERMWRLTSEITLMKQALALPVTIPISYSGFGVTSAAMSTMDLPTFHSGGVVGGLGADEVPIIAQSGEGIVSRRGMRALGQLNSGQASQQGNRDLSALKNTLSNLERAIRSNEQAIDRMPTVIMSQVQLAMGRG